LYGQQLTLVFKDYLRAEQKFDSLESLKTQLHADKVAALQALKLTY
jgi:riboflavin kinase / FMN adenylyltransferase